MKPWNGEHAARRISRPLRNNGVPYQGINVVMLWSAAMARHGSNQAYYTMAEDRVQMPHFETFRDADSYFGKGGERRTAG